MPSKTTMHVSEVVRARRPLARRTSGSDTQSARRGDRFTEAAAAVCARRHLAILAGVSFPDAPDSLKCGASLPLSACFPRKALRLSRSVFLGVSFPVGEEALFCVSSVPFLNARLRAVRRARQSVDTTPPYNESCFLLETYLPFLLFSAWMLFLKSTKHPYFVKKSLDLIFQRD